MGAELAPVVGAFLKAARVARLGTADSAGQPLVVPVCYAFDGRHCYSAIDAKPKRKPGAQLTRVRNIRENPRVCLVVDHYDEDWSRLRYVILQGRADLLTGGPEFGRAVDLLRDKYPQYRAMGLDRESGLVIKITPERVVQWSSSRGAPDEPQARTATRRGPNDRSSVAGSAMPQAGHPPQAGRAARGPSGSSSRGAPDEPQARTATRRGPSWSRRRSRRWTGAMKALERALAGAPVGREDAVALMSLPDEHLPDLLAVASALRDSGRGRRITFSKKVFVPLTTLCRDYCGYCTFRKDPGEPGAHTMTPEEVIALVQAGARLGCKEALFSLGDKPEALFPEHRAFLGRMGHRTTLGYLRAMCELVLKESPLLPHANPGLMSERDLSALREVNVSMGLMLESLSGRLLGKGLAHDRAPDKVPARRLKTIEWAGKLQIPFTTGILIGIGETHAERVDSLLAIRDLAERYGHIEEVIIQNFRAKPGIPMHRHPEPSAGDMLRTVAVARLLLGPATNIQAPPNLSPDTYPRLLSAGLNDWGGISPLTLDHINPEAPWPRIAEVRRATEGAGYELRERLAIYPEYARRPEFLADSLRQRVNAYTDSDGYVRQELEQWRTW